MNLERIIKTSIVVNVGRRGEVVLQLEELALSKDTESENMECI